MDEKRKSKRLKLVVDIVLERIDEEDDITTVRYARVNVTDISRGGIGFDTKQELTAHSYYNAKLQIWTKESIDVVIEIVRSSKNPDGTYHYGGIFVGMIDTDALKIDIYQMFNESNQTEDSE